MELVRRYFNLTFWLPSHQREAPVSYLLTKSHGLHNLDLCKACSDLDLRSLAQQESHIHLKNCFELIKTSKCCRVCAFISQTLQKGGSRKLQSVLVSYDILPDLNVPLCLRLESGSLEVILGEHSCVTKLEICSAPGRLMDVRFSMNS
jgi:hypothetical protein